MHAYSKTKRRRREGSPFLTRLVSHLCCTFYSSLVRTLHRKLCKFWYNDADSGLSDILKFKRLFIYLSFSPNWNLHVHHWGIIDLFLVFQETRTLAEIAKCELDGTVMNNRPLRIRFATHGSALTVRNLLPAVTNELLEQVGHEFQHFRNSFRLGCLSNLKPFLLPSGVLWVRAGGTGYRGDGWPRSSHWERHRGVCKQSSCTKSSGAMHGGSAAADQVSCALPLTKSMQKHLLHWCTILQLHSETFI